MRWLWLIIVTIVVVPIVEISLLVALGSQIGIIPTLLLMLATSALGGWLLRREGTKAWRDFSTSLAEGQPPGPTATNGLLVLIGGLLMLVPGFASDIFGLLLILPPTRAVARRLVLSVAERKLNPALANDLLGPRHVKVKVNRTTDAAGPSGPPIVGEILPRDPA